MHSQRPKLADQIHRELLEGIESRRWEGTLPKERNLADDLHVSRSTLRQALHRLRTAGVLETVHSKGNRIRSTAAIRPASKKHRLVVNILVPSATWRLRNSPLNWTDQLRAQLAAEGCEMHILHGESCYSKKPERALENLLRRNPCDCWLVRLSTLPLQQWLEKRGVPAVLAGTPFPGIHLPFIDVDQRAVARHATGLILAAGHRRIALLMDKESKAGDIEMEIGFAEAIRASPNRTDIQMQTYRYESNVDGIIRTLDGMIRRKERPTALQMPNANYCMTIWSYLGRQGMRIPEDMSVVAQVGPMELSYLTPEPTYYILNVSAYAQKLTRAILAQIEGGVVPPHPPIFPELVRGGSLGPPPHAV